MLGEECSEFHCRRFHDCKNNVSRHWQMIRDVLGIHRHLRRQHCSNLLGTSRFCQTVPPASNSCFSCFRCSAIQKIISSGYSTSTQANLNTTFSHFLLSLAPSLFPWHIIKTTFIVHPSPLRTSIYTITSAAVNQLYFICSCALATLHLCTT